MRREQLEHIIRAAADITKETEFIIIGSQAILGQYPNAPEPLLVSMEADLYPPERPELSDFIDGAIGRDTQFDSTFGYHADRVSPNTATLPAEWGDRLTPIQNANTNGATGWCIEVHDIAIAKYAAAEPVNDFETVRSERRPSEQMTNSISRACKILPVLGLLFLTCALWGRAAWACSCMVMSEKEMVRSADIAVKATAITDALFDIWTGDVRPHRSSQQAVTVFRVDQVLKGPLPENRIAVLHNTYPPTCGLRFAPDVRYLLIFVRKRDNKPRPLVAGLCAVKAIRPDDR